MSEYEAMLIVQPNINEERKKELFDGINDTASKNGAEIISSSVWSEKRKLSYPIKKFQEGIYYLIAFKAGPAVISKLKQAYKLNENIIRLLIVKK
jgi:small subunit ribosomal protein S6